MGRKGLHDRDLDQRVAIDEGFHEMEPHSHPNPREGGMNPFYDSIGISDRELLPLVTQYDTDTVKYAAFFAFDNGFSNINQIKSVHLLVDWLGYNILNDIVKGFKPRSNGQFKQFESNGSTYIGPNRQNFKP